MLAIASPAAPEAEPGPPFPPLIAPLLVSAPIVPALDRPAPPSPSVKEPEPPFPPLIAPSFVSDPIFPAFDTLAPRASRPIEALLPASFDDRFGATREIADANDAGAR